MITHIEHIRDFLCGEDVSPPEMAADMSDDPQSALNLFLRSAQQYAEVLCTGHTQPLLSATRGSFLARLNKKSILLICFCTLLAGTGSAWALHTIFSEPALLYDNFNSDWGDVSVWSTPRRFVGVEGGHARILDRGYLVTKAEFPEPLQLSFRWKWLDLTGDFQYRDTMTIALRSSGKPREEFTYEAEDGIIIGLNATGGCISIAYPDAPGKIAYTPKGALKFSANNWHDVTITDDGEMIRVFLRSPGTPESLDKKPILEARIPRQYPHHHIGFYNRERLAGASFESWLDDIEIRPLHKMP